MRVTARGTTRPCKRIVEKRVSDVEMRRLMYNLPFGIDDHAGRFRRVRVYVEEEDGRVDRVYEWRKKR